MPMQLAPSAPLSSAFFRQSEIAFMSAGAACAKAGEAAKAQVARAKAAATIFMWELLRLSCAWALWITGKRQADQRNNADFDLGRKCYPNQSIRWDHPG